MGRRRSPSWRKRCSLRFSSACSGVDAIDQVLLEEQDAQIALEQLRQELAAKAEGADADEALSLLL